MHRATRRPFLVLAVLLASAAAVPARGAETAEADGIRAFLTEPARLASYLLRPGEAPAAGWAHPARVRASVGEVSLRAELFGPVWQPVERADMPGRHGVRLSGTTAAGLPVVRYSTAYVLPAGTVPDDAPVRSLPDPAAALGISPAVWTARAEEVEAALGTRSLAELARDPAAARFLAALSECMRPESDLPLAPAAAAREYWLPIQRAAQCGKEGCTLFRLANRAAGEPAPTLPWPPATPGPAFRNALGSEAARGYFLVAELLPAGPFAEHRLYALTAADGGGPETGRTRPADSLGKTLAAVLLLAAEQSGLAEPDAPLASLLREFEGVTAGDGKGPVSAAALFRTDWTGAPPPPDWLPDPRAPEFPWAVAVALRTEAASWEALAPAVAPHLAWAALERLSGMPATVLVERRLLPRLGMEATRLGPNLRIRSTDADILRLAHLLLNEGAYGEWRFYAPRARRDEALYLPRPYLGGRLLLDEDWGVLEVAADGLGPGVHAVRLLLEAAHADAARTE